MNVNTFPPWMEYSLCSHHWLTPSISSKGVGCFFYLCTGFTRAFGRITKGSHLLCVLFLSEQEKTRTGKMNKKQQHKGWLETTKILLGVLFLLCGCIIYLLFRSKTLYIYVWCKSLGLANTIDSLRLAVCNWQISEFIRFSLPDGLYCAAYLLIIDAIWHQEKGRMKYILLALIPVITTGSELLQAIGLVRGTFDVSDLLCYSLPPLFFFVIELFRPMILFNK